MFPFILCSPQIAVEDREELDKDIEMVSEVVFKQDCKQHIINMEKTNHNLSLQVVTEEARATYCITIQHFSAVYQEK
jgi:hypothetical protein